MYNTNDRVGVSQVNLLVSKELRWIFREQPTDDYGIDAHIEVHDGDYATGKLIALQIKSGPSYFKEVSDDSIVFRGEEKHLSYWTKHSLPVIIVLFNPDTSECIWEHVSKEKITKTSGEKWKILIPRNNLFNKDSRAALRVVADNQSEYERRLNSLVLSKTWMKEIKMGNDVVLEAEEWVNKTSGKGSITLKIIDTNTMKEKTVIDWSFLVFFPGQMYVDVFGKIFPWAEIQIDKDFYEDYDMDRFLEEECPYDTEADEYVYLGDEIFESWKECQDEMRSYASGAGEVEYYRLKLTLNDLGTTFLKLDEYLEGENIYAFVSKDNIE